MVTPVFDETRDQTTRKMRGGSARVTKVQSSPRSRTEAKSESESEAEPRPELKLTPTPETAPCDQPKPQRSHGTAPDATAPSSLDPNPTPNPFPNPAPAPDPVPDPNLLKEFLFFPLTPPAHQSCH